MTEVLARSCWTAENARGILVTEALSGDDALFLATHTPVHSFDIGGSANDIEEATEEGLLRAISSPDRRHAFCVIQGEPGSGKSHLIRWLSVNWPNSEDCTLLVQRSNGSLEGALRQLQTRLPDEFQHLFQNLGRRQAAALSGRASQFLVTLGASLAHDYFAQPLADSGWCRENDPSSLLLNKYVRQQWSGPMRILKLMDGGAGERNSATASFNLEDILDLARFCSDVHDSVASERLARRIMREAAFIADSLAEGRTFDDIKTESAGEIRQSLSLINALNARRNYAVQHVIGVSADGLKKLFEDLRIELAKRKQRLVLLLEDITSWEGLDDSLVDVLVTDAETRPEADLCPLISVVGVTPEYFAKLPGNYRQRITHDIRLGQVQGQLQDVAALRESEDRSAFIARYLNAARAGMEHLRSWREKFRSERNLSPPNPCQTCVRVERCHQVFGEVEGVGLFPFTRESVDNFFFALKENDNGMTHRTPRGLVQAVLSPTLLHPKVMDEDGYPGAQLENNALERRPLPGVLQSRLSAHVQETRDRERLRRLLSYWGDRRPELQRRSNGEQMYAGLPESLVAAFGLPWIAGDVLEAEPQTQPVQEPERPLNDSDTPPPEAGLRKPSTARTRPATPRPAPRPAGPNRGQLERLRNEITALREGLPLQNSSTWNSALFEIVGRLSFRKLGVDRWTWSKIFTGETVKIAGTGQVRSSHFVIERTDWVADGLEAFAMLKTEDLPEEEAEYSRRRLASMMRRLEGSAADHLDKRLPKSSEGERWNTVATAVQVLLARAWLRGVSSPDQPTHEQWTALLSDEAEAESDPTARTQPWQDALSATKNRHDLLRKALHEMVRLPQGGSAGFGIADASVAAAALVSLRDRCELSPSTVPLDTDKLSGDLEALAEVGARTASLSAIPHQERKLLSSRAEQLFSLLRGQSVIAHLHRLDKVITEISDQVPSLLPHLIRDWKAALARQRRFFDNPSTVDRLQTAMIDVTDGIEELPSRRSSLLGWLAAAPAADLRSALELVQQGERLITEILPHVRDMISDAGRTPELAEIHRHGSVLRQAATRARNSLAQET
jgi:hypothetical protein